MSTPFVYVVIGSSGEYSDRSEWVAGVFTDKSEAIRIASEKLKTSKENQVLHDAWCRRREAFIRGNGLEQCWDKETRSLVWKDYSGAFVSWDEQEAIMAASCGESPKGDFADDYTVVEAGLDTWGRAENVDMGEVD